jgi:hypothetical protein
MNQEQPYNLGDGFIAIPLPNQGGWKIERKGEAWQTPEPLRAIFWSLAEARGAKDRWKKGKLKFRPGHYGFSLLNK